MPISWQNAEILLNWKKKKIIAGIFTLKLIQNHLVHAPGGD
jgi:hypothetical protein